ncbi:ferredoxin [Nocardioides sp. SR21]|uniref:(2Fe-2S) ferredoxin domain-containing protein n=1 Tax=Nocardioides sp. SR21 TaxID=2919501 RepID=UPI001FAACC5E|nr:(2Fe-2S) ferredoxin domain-containing protein [Nocardioides sp. SR21]
MTDHLVLVGMSVSDVDARDELRAEAENRQATLAFLQMGDPSLSAELTRLADAGATTITLVGIDRGPIAPGHSWLRRIAAHWWRERAGARPDVLVTTDLGVAVPITGAEPGLTSAAWADVSGHRHQVMLCRGPRCTAMGAVDGLRAMVLAIIEHELTDDDVLLVHTGCQFPCNQAPVVSVQPDDVWYGGVDATVAAEIVAEHLVAGRVVDSHQLPRNKGPETC